MIRALFVGIVAMVLLTSVADARRLHLKPRAERCEAIGIMYVRCLWKKH